MRELTYWVSVSIDFTDTTLVSEDTYQRLHWCDSDDSDEHDDYDNHNDHDDPDNPDGPNDLNYFDDPDCPDDHDDVGDKIRASECLPRLEMHSPTMLETKLELSWNLFGPPPGIEPGSPWLAANPSSH